MVQRTWFSRTFPRPMRYSIAIILSVAVTAGCGGGSGESDAIPAELVGTYTTTLQPGDIPSTAPPDLKTGEWKLVIATSGGLDDGPGLTIRPSTQEGSFEAPGLTVDGDTLKLEQEECLEKSGVVFYDNEYSWQLDGSTLTLTTVKNQCPDRVAETVLTSQPWTKQ